MFDIKKFSNALYSELKKELELPITNQPPQPYNENDVLTNTFHGICKMTSAPLILTIATVSGLAIAAFNLMKGNYSRSANNLVMLKTRISQFSIRLITGLSLLIPYVNKAFIEHVRNYKPYSTF